MKKYIYIIGAAVLMLTGCSQKEIEGWVGTDYARIVGPSVWTLDTDSMEYSFASYPASVTTFTVDASVWIEGANADYDRTVFLKVDGGTTAPAAAYSVPASVTVPAGQGRVSLPIVLNRISDLARQKYVLQVSLDDSQGQLKSGVKQWQTLTIKFSDILSRPKNWNDLEEFFGATYSDTKYRFIIDTLGFGSFTYLEAGGMSWGEMWNYHLLVVDALNKYNEAHSGHPLTDELGQLISFDN